jgi:hypothetical protein
MTRTGTAVRQAAAADIAENVGAGTAYAMPGARGGAPEGVFLF